MPGPRTAQPLQLQVRRVFATPPERLFEAWTSAEELKRWHAPAPNECSHVEVDLRVGGRFLIEMGCKGVQHRATGTYRVIDPPRSLTYTWQWEREVPEPETLITVEFRPHGSGTELVLTHTGFTSEESRDSHTEGWTGVLESCARVHD